MHLNKRRTLVCDCEHSMTIDAASLSGSLKTKTPAVHTQLCISQLENFRQALETGEPLLVGCTQQAPLFREEADGVEGEHDLRFVNIRERAGWSGEGSKATAKMAALLAEAAIDIPPTRSFTLTSDGVVLVYGVGEVALSAARQLAGRLNVTCLLADPADAMPPQSFDVPLFRGVIRQARGHLGAFEVTVDAFAAAVPSSRQALDFTSGKDGAVSRCDLILDLSGRQPIFPGPRWRDGYCRAEPSDPVAIQRALFDVADLVGEFEKPRYIKVNTAICAHSRNQITGCTKCLEACPTGALEPNGDHVSVAPAVCDGRGACASVCPTGAITYDLPSCPALFERARVLLSTYQSAGGEAPVLFLHDPNYGEEMIGVLARTGRGLPAHVLPFAVPEVPMVGLDFLLTALVYGAHRVRILCGPETRDQLAALEKHAEIIDAVLTELGYDGGRIVFDREPDPDALSKSLYEPPLPALVETSRHKVFGEKRTTLFQALDHLFVHAPTPAEVIDLPDGAPFGDVIVDQGKCTLCLSCVGACPTTALNAHPETPQLSFTEVNCVQCGLCRATCPEDAIKLVPGLALGAPGKQKRVLKEEEPFACIRCGKPFAARASIERVVAKMVGHSMFPTPQSLDLIRMCEDCRVMAQFEETNVPFAAGPRPRTRTTEDDLLDRARQDMGLPTKDTE